MLYIYLTDAALPSVGGRSEVKPRPRAQNELTSAHAELLAREERTVQIPLREARHGPPHDVGRRPELRGAQPPARDEARRPRPLLPLERGQGGRRRREGAPRRLSRRDGGGRRLVRGRPRPREGARRARLARHDQERREALGDAPPAPLPLVRRPRHDRRVQARARARQDETMSPTPRTSRRGAL